jgi:DNA-binding transcriptional regulator YhcF (GntR family)
MISFTINASSKIPVYKQLIKQFEAGIHTGKLKNGEQVMSMNELSAALDISKETVKKVYSILRDKGMLEAKQGKGFYISIPEEGLKPSILVIFDKLSAYKQTLFNSFSQVIGASAEVTILLHNQDVDLFEYYVDEYVGKYDYYVVTPHFSLDAETQKRVAKIMSRIPNRQLIMADHWMKSVPGNYGVVYQDFETDAAKGLAYGIRKIRKSGVLHVVKLENSLYGKQIEACVKDYCQSKGIGVRFYDEITPDIILRGGIYLMLNSSFDDGLIILSRTAKDRKMKIGKDISIISYNESPISEIVLGGLTTISTDFAQMGRLIAEMILEKRMSKKRCNFRMTRRASF